MTVSHDINHRHRSPVIAGCHHHSDDLSVVIPRLSSSGLSLPEVFPFLLGVSAPRALGLRPLAGWGSGSVTTGPACPLSFTSFPLWALRLPSWVQLQLLGPCLCSAGSGGGGGWRVSRHCSQWPGAESAGSWPPGALGWLRLGPLSAVGEQGLGVGPDASCATWLTWWGVVAWCRPCSWFCFAGRGQGGRQVSGLPWRLHACRPVSAPGASPVLLPSLGLRHHCPCSGPFPLGRGRRALSVLRAVWLPGRSEETDPGCQP